MKQNKKYIILSIMVFVIIMTTNIIISLNIYDDYNKKETNDKYLVIGNIISSNNDKDKLILGYLHNQNIDIGKNYLNDNITLNINNQIYNHNLKRNLIIYSASSTFICYMLFMLLIILYKKSQDKKINEISNYMNSVLNGNYSLDIRSYEEGRLSILKNDIYKITVKLKEQTDMAINEKNNLEMILSDISHQIKTPLTSMYVINDLLKSDKLSKKEKIEFLNKNESQLERIEWLVTSLLKLSRLDNGFVKLKKEKVEVAKLIDNCLNPLLIPIELKNQNVVKQIDNFEIDIDFNWFSEAIINILKNAHEHTNAFGTIKVEASDNSMYSSIIISDNGTGISKQDLPHIFERFYKGDNQKESIGIGLNMAKKIIDLSGGEINVLSTPSVGTTFIIKIYKNII